MNLEKALKEKPAAELREFYAFWEGQENHPGKAAEIVPKLLDQMTDEDLVRRRLKFLSKKLLDVLKFFLRSDSYTNNLHHILNSQAFSYMSQYEMEAALNALQKRGFLFSFKKKPKKTEVGTKNLIIPEELGEILQNFLWDEEKDIYDTFSLRGYLSKFPEDQLADRFKDMFQKPEEADNGKDLDAFCMKLLEPEEVSHRLDLLGDEDLKRVLIMTITEFGGVLPLGIYDKIKGKMPPWSHRPWKKALEKNLLGTVRHLSLGEYGINHFDNTLVIFHEVVDQFMTGLTRVDPVDFSEIKSLGVDLISDISSFLSFVSHNRIRLTLGGSIYRTAIKKVMDSFILKDKTEFEQDDIFNYIYSFCLGNRMIQRKGDRNLSLTVKGKAWDHQQLERKLFRLLSFAFEEWESGEDQFHLPTLKKMFVDAVKGLQINRWYDVMYLPFKCRNEYLALLEKNNIRDAFQNRYQYTQNTSMRETVQLAHSLFNWLRSRFYLLGLVDLGFRDGKVAAMKLTTLGAKALGIAISADMEYEQNPLIVNPDFEVILFQDGDSYDLITQLDKFAVRTKSDNTYHFKITSSSVEKAVAEDMTSSEILTLLSENSRVGIPQNVIYSIKEWAEKVKFVQVRQATLLRGRNKEVIDRIIQSGELKEVIVERLSPIVLVVSADIDSEMLGKSLERLGVFLEAMRPLNGQEMNGAATDRCDDGEEE
ncbi:MAG: helicase-associated domain-containing protein [Planctomycetota bacterium]|jgi:hypothetical protein